MGKYSLPARVVRYPPGRLMARVMWQSHSGNVKLNSTWHFPGHVDLQVSAIYLAPDIIPQGEIDSRYSVDAGIKKAIQKSMGELFLNATDIFNTMRIRKDIFSDNVRIVSTDLYETQIVRLGYSYKF